MPRPTLPSWIFLGIFIGAGLLVFLALQLQLAMSWRSYYALYPIPGYEEAMASGRIPPFFSSSERSLLVTRIVLAILPLLALPFAGSSPWKAAGGLWIGVMLATVSIWIATPALRQDSNMWPIDFAYLGVVTAIPLFLGALAYVAGKGLARKLVSRALP